MTYFLHCWNDNDTINTPKAQPHYPTLAKITKLDKHPIIFGFTNISDEENIVKFIDDKLYGKLREYKHIGIFACSSSNKRVFAHYLWSILLGYLRSGGDINHVIDNDVIQAINLIKKETSWLSCNVPHEIDLVIAYEKNSNVILELNREKFLTDNEYVKSVLNEYGLLVKQDIFKSKINIPNPYKKEFLLK